MDVGKKKREKDKTEKDRKRERQGRKEKKGKWSGFVTYVSTYVHVSAKPTKICNLSYYQKLGTEPTRHDGEKKCTSYEVT